MSYNPEVANAAAISFARATLWIGQVHIEVSGHQQVSPSGTPADEFDAVLYVQVVIRGNITPHSIPPLSPCHQMEDEKIWSMEAERLQREFLYLAV